MVSYQFTDVHASCINGRCNLKAQPDDPDNIIMIIYILNKYNHTKKIIKNKLFDQFLARSGPILFDPVIRPDPVNTRTVKFHIP